MQNSEIVNCGDREERARIERLQAESHKLLKLLIEVYDQKNLAIRLRELGCGYEQQINREKLNRWRADPVSNPIVFSENAIEDIRSKLLPAKPAHWDEPDFKFIDLFAGIGGLRKGFEDIGGKCVFTSEWDQRARRTYLANHYVDEHELPYFIDSADENQEKNSTFMDITKITKSGEQSVSDREKLESIRKHIPEHDVLLAGFPCQPFSLAGVSKKNSLGRSHGFDCNTQGTLFFDVEQILLARKPKFFVLENVKNLKSHDKGNTFATIVRALDRAGYWVANITDVDDDIEEAICNVRKRKPEPTIIDGAHFTPQHRERIVLVGVRKDLIDTDDSFRQICLSKIEKPKARYSVADILCELELAEKEKYTLTPNLWNYLYHYALKHQSKGNGFGFGLIDPANPNAVTRTLSARYYKDGSEILINQDGLPPEYLEQNREFAIRKNTEREQAANLFARRFFEDNPEPDVALYKEKVKEGEKEYDSKYGRYASEFDSTFKTPRRLTPQECARLMGFEKPDFDRESNDADFRIVCADTAAYKQFGNSVVVPVFRAVAKLMRPYILNASN
ncbi:DNA (cytosine-5-)-methyltransferase [Pseudoalteromonas rubra]|uniref:Cytosine-specific methyltransferase n=1 Tax=Pseudoalteromonas rubra TaxID=43658 RepID=A0A5S3USB1_9GAMM|nr:DNA (cytosine-5-)-methyltransferase [Pseudoalteromonas rubra]QPB84570.1 DNA (cytosine-5-)-methyltransferase [Pseudoalteromonas rubra]